MNNLLKKIALGVAVVLLGWVGSLVGFATHPVSVVEKTINTLGALGPHLPSPWFEFGGVTRYASRLPLAQSTTTSCAIQSPAATSTLQFGSGVTFQVSSTSATAVLLEIDKQVAQYGTTTTSVMLATSTIASTDLNKSVNAWATTTQNNTLGELAGLNKLAVTDRTFAPSTWFVVHAYGSTLNSDVTATGFVPEGTCNATFNVF